MEREEPTLEQEHDTTLPSTSTNKTLALIGAILTGLIFALLVASPSALSSAASGDEKQLSIYAPVATYTLPVLERAGHEYIGLLELLEPLGRVSSESSGKRLRIRYNAIDGEFDAGRTRSRIHGHDVNLTAPFLIENSRGLVPLASLGTLLPRFLGSPVNFHESARRLFVGEIGIRPGFKLESAPQPHLVLSFSAPVNPTISTEPGRVRMVFKRDPIVSPGSQSISFESQAITQASFSEANGLAELDVAASIPLIASFSDNGKTITLSAPPAAANPSAATGTGTTKTAQPSSTSNVPTSVPSNAPASAAAVARVLAVVDPAHGGSERGAALSDQLAEKDVTLGFGRLLRHELETRDFAVLLLRDNDNTLGLDQRAGAANGAGAAVYITLHAASQGSGALVYTALLPVEDASNGPFRGWNSAQSSALPLSRAVAGAIVSEMQKKQILVRASSASLRPLNNVVMPAVAVELAPGSNGVSDLASANYQQEAAAAIAEALAGLRSRLGVQQ